MYVFKFRVKVSPLTSDNLCPLEVDKPKSKFLVSLKPEPKYRVPPNWGPTIWTKNKGCLYETEFLMWIIFGFGTDIV